MHTYKSLPHNGLRAKFERGEKVAVMQNSVGSSLSLFAMPAKLPYRQRFA
jgi:hypothetical protein